MSPYASKLVDIMPYETKLFSPSPFFVVPSSTYNAAVYAAAPKRFQYCERSQFANYRGGSKRISDVPDCRAALIGVAS
ncbi:hypothetical protein EVAR_35962_1 [Eumeta japonica]|uniref:Uncharacterized protein n=1 Tax=Eumeta variegata TaxID=151549 RepID=A0A4C1W3W5_EUMVA|nr:hypothetical protein EVAR_35962_1 [Eumeta japonica]